MKFESTPSNQDQNQEQAISQEQVRQFQERIKQEQDTLAEMMQEMQKTSERLTEEHNQEIQKIMSEMSEIFIDDSNSGSVLSMDQLDEKKISQMDVNNTVFSAAAFQKLIKRQKDKREGQDSSELSLTPEEYIKNKLKETLSRQEKTRIRVMGSIFQQIVAQKNKIKKAQKRFAELTVEK